MKEYIEFEGDLSKDLTLGSLIKRISRVYGICGEIEIDFQDGPNWDLERGKASIKLKGNFDPSKVYSIITDSGYTITKIGNQRFNF